MKPIVIYTSKYGSTEKYAKWIAETLNCPAKRLQDVSAQEVNACDTIVYGGGLYASGVAGLKKFLSRLDPAQDAKLVLFMVGMTNPAETETYAEIAERNLPLEWRDRFVVFALRGDQLFSKMSAMHKLMMRVPKTAAEKKPESERTEDDRRFIESYGKDSILSSREQVEPILRYLQQES